MMSAVCRSNASVLVEDLSPEAYILGCCACRRFEVTCFGVVSVNLSVVGARTTTIKVPVAVLSLTVRVAVPPFNAVSESVPVSITFAVAIAELFASDVT